MSSMSGQQFNTKSMTGISNSYVNNIITDAIEVTTNLTVDNGAVVILPNSSISDNALSSNVPLKNSSNIFTNTQIISNQNILQIKGTSGYARLQYIDTGNYLELQNMTSSGIIRIKATGSTGLTTFSMDISSTGFNIYKSLFLSNSASITFPDTTIQTTAYPGSSNFALLNANNIFTGVTNTFPTPSTSDNSQTVCTTAFVKNQSYITASSLAPYALLASDNTFTGTGNNVPMPLLTDNSLIIANTSFVKGQNYITASALSPYALLATNNTFLGTANTMPTPATATNSTVVATTAFVKAQLYSPLAGTNTFTGICTFNNAGPTIINQLAMPSSSSQLFTVLNSGFIGAVQLSIPNATLPKFQVNSLGNVLSCGTIYIPNNGAPLCTISALGSVNCSNFGSTGNISIPNSTTPVFRVNGSGQIDYCNSIYIPNTTSPVITLPASGKITCVSVDGNSTTQLSGDNTQKIATTAFVQSALPTLTNYALLNNGILTQNFLGNNIFSHTAGVPPIQITNPTLTTVTGSLVLCNTSAQYSPCTVLGDFIVGSNDTVTTTGSIVICPLSTSTSAVRVSNTDLDLYGGTGIKCHNKITTTYNTTTYVAPTNLQIGFVWYGVAFTSWLLASSTNIWTVTWDNTGDKLWGTFLVEIFIITTGSGTMLMSASFNEISGTTFLSDKMCNCAGPSNLPSPYLGLKTCTMTFTLSIHVSTTYYLNTYVSPAGTNVAQTGSSYIKFTRIA